MKATVTYIELKSPFLIFKFVRMVSGIIKQLKNTACQGFRSQGYWTKYYTITLWNDEAELKSFATNGAHLEAMKRSQEMAKEIKTITFDTYVCPTWKEAKAALKQAKTLKF